MDDMNDKVKHDGGMGADIPPDTPGYDAPESAEKINEEVTDKEVSDKDVTDEAADAVDDSDGGEDGEGKLRLCERKKLRRLESECEALKKQLEAAKQITAALNDKYLRMLAEYDNYRKRTTKEKEACYTDACADALAALLPVLDNLERAALFRDSESVAKGVEMTLGSFNEVFNKFGIKTVGAVGEKFDPNLHNAVLHIEDENFGEGEIVEVLRKGYALGDKILRYAMVKVAN